ncbi:MAG: glycosyltransferase family 4 protein [Lautropia sp.]
MKLLFVIDHLGGGGAQRQLVNVAAGLRERGHAVTVFTYHRNDAHLARLEAAGAEHVHRPKRSRFDLGPLRALHRMVRQDRPDVVVAFLRTPSFYVEAVHLLARSTPVIVSERAGVEHRGLQVADIASGLGHLIATHLTANSHDYLERLARVLPIAGRSTVIYNGVEPKFFDAGRARIAQDEADAAQRCRLCVVSARVTRQKGPMPLALALSTLREAGTEVDLDWIGPLDEASPLVRDVKAVIAARGLDRRWRWLGRVADVERAYGRYDGLVLPSVFEGVANTMCEAMACGLPVIVTDIADNARIVRDGVDGIVCRADDPAALARAIARFVAMDVRARRRMGVSAQARARELFSMDTLVGQWEALCERIATGAGNPDSNWQRS